MGWHWLNPSYQLMPPLSRLLGWQLGLLLFLFLFELLLFLLASLVFILLATFVSHGASFHDGMPVPVGEAARGRLGSYNYSGSPPL